MAYSIGQVLYVVSQKTQNIVPVQVVERIVKSTLRGDEVIYRVMGPKGEGPHDLEQIDGQIYTDPKAMRHEIRQKAVSAVDKMVDRSIHISNQAFQAPAPASVSQESGLTLKNGRSAPQPQLEDDDPVTLEEGEIEIGTDPDGKPIKARVRSVTEAPPPPKQATS